ncbi:MAG: hypothetical protein M3527_05920 [Actinomycetota bacterium]|nr:hypothetical protein [Acidimicrobiia bacterium]MDQ3293968.1 hypothetical protein [Actinomycetota bacterium]
MRKARWFAGGVAAIALGVGAALSAPSAQAAEPKIISVCARVAAPNGLIVLGIGGPLLGGALGLPTHCEG